MFAFFQVQSVYRGYTRNSVTQRPFMMTLSGAPGIQRYGATQWSADIGSNFSTLATWDNVQMHMVLSGIDYYSSDIGGFHRTACGAGCDINDLYTQWYATGMMFGQATHGQYIWHPRNLARSHRQAGSQPRQYTATLRVEAISLLAGLSRTALWRASRTAARLLLSDR